ncbi:hypothetical protein KGF47_18170 [Clostridioides sp. ZZV13-5731]|uniref:hypothetical protein n=1 Tax=Clostridioides sp. ZZV13-5731 TaxID=2811485 RepID=UPI001D12D6B5|nr:hypothetical protein [Clostridioides sp. ZZV13-5731]
MKNLFKEAHKMARKIKAKYNNVDYKVQFSLCLSFLNKKGDTEMEELKGSEKQIKWAIDIRKDLILFVDELEKIKMERIKNEDYKIKDMSKGEMTERCKRKFERIREEIRNIESAKFFIDNFRYILEHNSLDKKAFYINQKLKDSQFTKESRNWTLLQGETQAPHRLKKNKDYSISYEEAKKIAKEIKFSDNWTSEIKENVIEIVKIFDDAVKQATNTEYIEKTVEYIIETLIQKNGQFYRNGFADIKKKEIENYKKIESAERKIELTYLLFKKGVEC